MINLNMHGVRSKQIIIDQTETVEVLPQTATTRYDNADVANTPLQELKTLRIEKLKEECTSAIYAGFTSPSLGYGFGFNELDQTNFNQQYLLIISSDNAGKPVKWKSKTDGIVEMTESQFRRLVIEARDHKMMMQQKYWVLESTILLANSKEKVQAVIWG